MKMSFSEFSRQLILTQDLDPDYIFLRSLHAKPDELLLWIQCKIFIYDTASEYIFLMRDQPWEKLKFGAERRKNRQKGEKQMWDFINHFDLRELPLDYNEARIYLTDSPGIGDWAAWKFCDLLERVLEHPMDFSKVDFRKAYEYPLRGLCRVIGKEDEDVHLLKNDDFYDDALMTMLIKFGDAIMLEAPCGRRRVDIQEIETCLCKYHSYLTGHYYIGKDTEHLIKRLTEDGIEFQKNLFELPKNPLNL